MKKIRKWTTGADRDTNEGKLDFEGCLNPLILETYAKYMQKHQTRKDGTQRESDNWQNLFGEEHFDICMESAWRHFHDWWKEHRGYKSQEGIEDAICGVLFNAQAYLLKILLDKSKTEKESSNPMDKSKTEKESSNPKKSFWGSN